MKLPAFRARGARHWRTISRRNGVLGCMEKYEYAGKKQLQTSGARHVERSVSATTVSSPRSQTLQQDPGYTRLVKHDGCCACAYPCVHLSVCPASGKRKMALILNQQHRNDVAMQDAPTMCLARLVQVCVESWQLSLHSLAAYRIRNPAWVPSKHCMLDPAS